MMADDKKPQTPFERVMAKLAEREISTLSEEQLQAKQREIDAQNRERIEADRLKAQQRAIEESLSAEGIPKRYQRKSLANWQAVNEQAVTIKGDAEHWQEHLAKHLDDGNGLLLIGNPGTGKTHLAVTFLMAARAAGYTVAYMTASQITSRIKSTYKTDELEEQVIKQLGQIDLLVIDELGDQPRDKQGNITPTEKNLIMQVVDFRYRECKSTIAISNFSLKTLEQQLGTPLVDRFREVADCWRFNWTSQRGACFKL